MSNKLFQVFKNALPSLFILQKIEHQQAIVTSHCIKSKSTRLVNLNKNKKTIVTVSF